MLAAFTAGFALAAGLATGFAAAFLLAGFSAVLGAVASGLDGATASAAVLKADGTLAALSSKLVFNKSVYSSRISFIAPYVSFEA